MHHDYGTLPPIQQARGVTGSDRLKVDLSQPPLGAWAELEAAESRPSPRSASRRRPQDLGEDRIPRVGQ